MQTGVAGHTLVAVGAVVVVFVLLLPLLSLLLPRFCCYGCHGSQSSCHCRRPTPGVSGGPGGTGA